MNETRTFLWRIEHVVFMVCVVKSKDRDILRECFREIVAAGARPTRPAAGVSEAA